MSLVPHDRKSVSGIPLRGFAWQAVDLAAQGRIARARLWPPTLVYGIGSAVVIALAVWRQGWRACLPWVAAGFLLWTWTEYSVHRFVLHGIFPNGPGFWRKLLHRAFDHLHWHHHREPWNGRHISGTLRDTGPFVAALAAVAAAAPLPTAPAAMAAFLLGYVIEEWVHLSVHFAGWRGRYFRYIRKHHMYHHGNRGRDVAFGLTSDAWDRVYGTAARVPAADRSPVRTGARPLRPPGAPLEQL
jgi:sterol desaturase/sphingolipid hydroxylase (fatty acid hydroxylase superfamily)